MSNETAYFVAEYNSRQKLQKLGFVDSLDSLDAITAEYFIEITNYRNELDEAELKAKGRK